VVSCFPEYISRNTPLTLPKASKTHSKIARQTRRSRENRRGNSKSEPVAQTDGASDSLPGNQSSFHAPNGIETPQRNASTGTIVESRLNNRGSSHQRRAGGHRGRYHNQKRKENTANTVTSSGEESSIAVPQVAMTSVTSDAESHASGSLGPNEVRPGTGKH
jgi:hypothetical protein